MIAHIEGVLIQKSVNGLVVDVSGIGYHVFVPLSTFYDLPDIGFPVSLEVYTHVREDAIQLYGFRTAEEKEVFQLMISVSGIGPRLATNILSGISAPEFAKAVCSGDLKKLVGIPGIGRKTADRMIFELRDKLSKLSATEGAVPIRTGDSDDRMKEDALSALVNLGYKSGPVKDVVEKVIEEAETGLTLELLLKKALKILAK